MKKMNWQIPFGIGLVALSVLLYFLHYLIFHDAHHIGIYLVGDIAFVPIEVLMVTLIIHQLLKKKEKDAMLNKLNMVIGIFFSDTGTELVSKLLKLNTETDKIRDFLLIQTSWKDKDYKEAHAKLKICSYKINVTIPDLEQLKEFLLDKRPFIISLLKNPSLLEHQKFTNLLWATTHLTEELVARPSLTNLPVTDIEHIKVDTKRACKLLLENWLDYMNHLRSDYPYLYSLAVRTNPFNPDASPIVK